MVRSFAIGLLLLTGFGFPALAEDDPVRSVRIIVPFGASGPAGSGLPRPRLRGDSHAAPDATGVARGAVPLFFRR
jgi:hypothetical protein